MRPDKNGRWIAFVASIAYTIVFHFVYVDVISPLFAYDGSIYAPTDEPSVLIGGVAAVLPSLWLSAHLRRPSDVVLWIMYLIGYVPASLLLYYLEPRPIGELVPFTLVMTSSMWILAAMSQIRRPHWMVPIRFTPRAFSNCVALVAFAAIGYMAVTTGLSLNIPGLLDVYDTRETFGETVGDAGSGVAYVVVWAANVVAPLLMAIGLRRRGPILVMLGILLELMVYAVTGFKSALFASILVVGLLVLIAVRRTPRAAWLPASASFLVAGIVLLDHLNESIVATSILVRRVLEVPALVTVRYFDYFSDHATFNLGHSFLRFWMLPPSELTPPELVGSAYFHANTWANGGLWADAFANFGLAGIIAFSIGLGAILWLLDVVADRTDFAVTGSVVAVVAVILTNTALFTAVQSHGLGLLILAYGLMPRRDDAIDRVAHAASEVPAAAWRKPSFSTPRVPRQATR
jgi:hypothetical protein